MIPGVALTDAGTLAIFSLCGNNYRLKKDITKTAFARFSNSGEGIHEGQRNTRIDRHQRKDTTADAGFHAVHDRQKGRFFAGVCNRERARFISPLYGFYPRL